MAYDQYYNNKINGEIKEADINMIKHLKSNKEAIKTHILKHKDKIKNNNYKGGKGHQNKIVKEFGNYYNNNKDTIQNKTSVLNKQSDNKTIEKYELDKKEIDDYKDKREELRNKYKEPTKEQLKDNEFKNQYKKQLKNQEYLKERDKINSLNDEELTKYIKDKEQTNIKDKEQTNIKDKEQTNNKYPSISDKSSEEDVFNLLPSKKKNYRSLDSDNSGYESTKSEYKRENYKLKNDLSRLSNDLYEKKLIIDNKEIIIKEVL